MNQFLSSPPHLPAQAFYWSYAAWGLMEAWVFSRDRRRVAGQGADRSTLWVVVFGIGLSVAAAFYCARGGPPMARVVDSLREWLSPAGIGLIWAGMALRLWAILTLGGLFRTTVVIQDQHRLVTAGPYRLLRNPSYTGSLITLAGIGLALGNWLSLLAIVTGPLLAYGWRLKVEQAALRTRFGEAYDAYAKRTWALIPFVW